MKKSLSFLPISALTILVIGTAQAALISHYTFDVDSAGTTPDAIGSSFATLGSRVQISTTVPGRIGGGALEMLGSGDTAGPANGAVTSNNFSWTTDARTVTFWWRAATPNANTLDGSFVSFGDISGSGTRFEVKEQHNGSANSPLRVEVQGPGQGTSPTNFDDGNWHFVAVTVPTLGTAGDGGAAFRDVAWYVDGSTIDLNTSTNALAIVTGTGPLAFGDSILTAPSNDRVPNGFLDDVQLYDEALTTDQIGFLFSNPGSVIPETSAAALIALGGLSLLRRRRK